jgi:hypothetical protein
MAVMGADPLPLFVLWEKVVGELLDRTLKFPKSVRFTFSGRIDNLALDVLEKVVEARYASGADKRAALAMVDLRLTQLRVLLRLCHDRRYLDRRGYEHVMRQIDEAGRMVGGWRKQQAAR